MRDSRRAFTLAEIEYRVGAADLLSVLYTQRTLFAAQDALAQCRLDRLQALVALFRALGWGMATRRYRMIGRLQRICQQRGIRMSEQRRVILQVLDTATDHPTAEEVHQRVALTGPRISLATIYRTLNILADAGLLSRVELGDGKAHYEEASDEHHEHLIDVETGKVVEFRNDALTALLREAVERLGYRLVQYRLELFGVPEQANESDPPGVWSPASYSFGNHIGVVAETASTQAAQIARGGAGQYNADCLGEREEW